jgi:putative membrane protein
VMELGEADRALVADAVTRAEQSTAGEIVTVVAQRSDRYDDVAGRWIVLAVMSVVAALAIRSSIADWLYRWVMGEWAPVVPAAAPFTVALVLMVIAWVAASGVMAWQPLRLALTPPATKARRVHDHALALFAATVDRRTRGATGVLLFVSLAERRAEIVAEQAIHARVDQDIWGEAMGRLVAAVRAGRLGEGLAESVTEVGGVLAEHFPPGGPDPNELPDRVVEL